MHVMLSACCSATLSVHECAYLPGARKSGRAVRARRRKVRALHSERAAGVFTCERAHEWELRSSAPGGLSGVADSHNSGFAAAFLALWRLAVKRKQVGVRSASPSFQRRVCAGGQHLGQILRQRVCAYCSMKCAVSARVRVKVRVC
jgi:hypothetical protein